MQNPQAVPEPSKLTEPEKPIERRYSTQDATPEALLELAASNPDGLLIFRDELQGIYANLSRPGRENERTLYLEGWDAKSSYRTDRIMRNAAPVERLCLSVFGGTQPSVLQAHISSAYGFGHGADGFIQRFQLAVLNTTNPPYRNEDCTPNSDAYDKVMHLFQKLDEGKFEDFGAQRDEKGNAFLRFSETAQLVFNAWLERNAHKVQALNADGDEPLSNHFAKYNKLVPALALLFHLSSVPTDTPNMIPGTQGISLEALSLALKWADFLEQHARAIYGRVGSNQLSGKHLAQKILELFRSGKVEEGISQRDLRRALGKSSGEVGEALAELEELGWLRVQNARKHKGRSTTIIILHPEFTRFSER